MNDTEITIFDVIEFIRKWGGFKRSQEIDGSSCLESGLGITGDDGDELLEAASSYFSVQLADKERGYRTTFDLKDNDLPLKFRTASLL
ncbi:hypothetical protein [Persicirhabdus sediminis]|uniref:Uncharacterized protein n=1 Tax=Persicirhabdus sediminis TaxID=454144 RepID=A0A8J7MDH4_9BACT|nr:hypothetical protein [Persicirhabdus sediminis]MBK1790595.1 hypothetical protein [Persicirhabdus sediminis]